MMLRLQRERMAGGLLPSAREYAARFGLTRQRMQRARANALIMHPEVADVAVIGVPNEDLGEEVRAVVQLVDPARAGTDTEAALLTWCADRLAAFKRPRGVDFDESLPRDPNGKLMKRYLRDRYWPTDSDSRIV